MVSSTVGRTEYTHLIPRPPAGGTYRGIRIESQRPAALTQKHICTTCCHRSFSPTTLPHRSTAMVAPRFLRLREASRAETGGLRISRQTCQTPGGQTPLRSVNKTRIRTCRANSCQKISVHRGALGARPYKPTWLTEISRQPPGPLTKFTHAFPRALLLSISVWKFFAQTHLAIKLAVVTSVPGLGRFRWPMARGTPTRGKLNFRCASLQGRPDTMNQRTRQSAVI